MSCLNKSLPEAKELIKELGEIKAIVAFDLNNEKIPTLEQANKLLESKSLNILHHAETALDDQNKRSGQLGEGLSEVGKKEAEIVSKTPEIQSLKTLYVSNAPRAVETAEIYKKNNPNLEVITKDDLKCWDAGKFVGKPEKEFPQQYYIKRPDEKVPDGESYNDYKTRFLNVIQELRSSGENIGILTHNDGIKLLNHLSKNFGDFNPNKYIEDNKNFKVESIQTIRQFNQEKSNINYQKESQVNAIPKSVQVADTPKAKQEWSKLQKGNISFDQFLNNSQFPKNQKALLKDIYNQEHPKSIDDLVMSLAAKYTYTVEINTAKQKKSNIPDQGYFNHDEDYIPGIDELARDYDDRELDDNSRNYWFTDKEGSHYTQDSEQFKNRTVYYKGEKEISQQLWEAEKAKVERVLKAKYLSREKEIPTQHYSNLTVQGGTNYTENEISTPGIVPSIKGHASFSTDFGIGWVRWDDQINHLIIDSVINALKQSGRLKIIC